MVITFVVRSNTNYCTMRSEQVLLSTHSNSCICAVLTAVQHCTVLDCVYDEHWGMVLLQENLKREIETLKNLQEAMEKDPILQLQSFRSKGIIKQSALVASILIANQVIT
jgi:hypothetical protein